MENKHDGDLAGNEVAPNYLQTYADLYVCV